MICDSSYERDKLYEEVWSEPVTAVAKRYGVSDVAIHKTCKRLQVPVPPRGYWARLSAGQLLAREPLPPYDGPQTVRRLALPSDRPRPSPLRSRESSWCSWRNKSGPKCSSYATACK